MAALRVANEAKPRRKLSKTLSDQENQAAAIKSLPRARGRKEPRLSLLVRSLLVVTRVTAALLTYEHVCRELVAYLTLSSKLFEKREKEWAFQQVLGKRSS